MLSPRASLLRSSFLRLQNAIKYPAHSPFTSRVNHDSGNAATERRFVYLGNLPWTLDYVPIKNEAEKFGTLLSIDIPDQDGASPGFANVEFESAEDALNFYRTAVQSKLAFEGRFVRAELCAEPRKEVVRNIPQVHLSPPSTTLFVGLLPRNTTKEDIQTVFSPFGDIRRLDLVVPSTSSAFAHVQFASVSQAVAAMDALRASHSVDASPRGPGALLRLFNTYIKLDYAAVVSRSQPTPPSDRLYFSRFEGTLEDLKEALKGFEERIMRIKPLHDTNGFIYFKTVKDAQAALESLDRTQTPSGHSLQLYFTKRNTKVGSRRRSWSRAESDSE